MNLIDSINFQFVLNLVSLPFAIMAITGIIVPLAAVLAELRPKVAPATKSRTPRVSVVVPAYNEGKVLRPCLDSILDSGYANLELIVVDDGSTDDTPLILAEYSDRALTVYKENGGKGSALNAGLARATGEILLFVDADGVFTQDTIPNMLAGFRHRKVGAVCGNDQPVNTKNALTRILALMTHTGTGLARRGLALIGALPIVAGNSGAFRASVIREIGGFREDTLGEDLELTWRVQEAGYEVEFSADAVILAEVPEKWGALWKQRVRWARGLLQTARHHRREFLTPTKSMFHLYLPINFFSQLVQPIIQLIAIVLMPILVIGLGLATGSDFGAGTQPSIPSVWIILGLGVSAANVVLALVLDRTWRDFRHLIVLPLLFPFSIFLSCTAVRAMWLELRGARHEWDKLERTGRQTVSVR